MSDCNFPSILSTFCFFAVMTHQQDRDSVGPHYSQYHSHISHKETEMVQKCRRLLDSGDIDDPFELLQNLCLVRGYSCFLGLGRHFREIAHSKGNTLSLKQFTCALKDAGYELSNEQVQEIFNRFEPNNEGGINISNLILALRVSESGQEINCGTLLDRFRCSRKCRRPARALFTPLSTRWTRKMLELFR